MINKIRATKLGERAADAVQEAIINGQFKPGDSLPSEVDLIAKFGISRPTLREAVRILESRGLVKVYRGKKGGAEILHPTEAVAAAHAATFLQVNHATLQELQHARACIEPELIRSLEGRLKPTDLENLRSCLRNAEASIDQPEEYAANITQFHATLFNLMNNKVLSLMASMLHIIYEPMAAAFIGEYSTEDRRAGLQFELARQQRLLSLLESAEYDKAADFCRSNLARIGKILDHGGAGKDIIGSQS